MVNKFRQFLNESPLFEEFRVTRRAVIRERHRVGTQPAMGEGNVEQDEDDNGDDNEDYEGHDGAPMMVDAQTQNPWPATAHAHGHATANLYQQVPVPPQHANFPISGYSTPLPFEENYGPLQYSSFITNQPQQGHPPLSAHGYANMASANQANQQASMAGANSTATGASTASMQQTFPNHSSVTSHQASQTEPPPPTQ